jgi:hypothetical protein
MNKPHQIYPAKDERAPVVPTHGNWNEERAFGQQTSAAAGKVQYNLRLAEPKTAQNK